VSGGGIPPEWLRPADLAVAKQAQLALSRRVEREDRFGPVHLLGGVDISTTRFDPENLVYAAVVVLTWPGLQVVARAGAVQRASLPYVPGYLGFREVPALLEAWEKLAEKPGLVLVDGHGLAHPRGFGIATHLGVALDVPTIGCAKSVLVGRVEGELGPQPGAEAPLMWKGQRLGTALRTRKAALPILVSTGHRVGLDSAVDWVRRCLTGYRLPEPTRQAHLAANAVRRGEE
jgi:deoxyribonuclease V